MLCCLAVLLCHCGISFGTLQPTAARAVASMRPTSGQCTLLAQLAGSSLRCGIALDEAICAISMVGMFKSTLALRHITGNCVYYAAYCMNRFAWHSTEEWEATFSLRSPSALLRASCHFSTPFSRSSVR